MAQDVEKKFKDVFERSPGAFPEGTSLEPVHNLKKVINYEMMYMNKDI